MPLLVEEISHRLAQSLAQCDYTDITPAVSPTNDTRFGDYQTNVAMQIAKAARTNPREVAQRICEKFDTSGLTETPEIAGAGFINFRILNDKLVSTANTMCYDERLGLPVTETPKTIIIDFSSPNVAKPMHVGHIRSTIIGDCLARVARFVGHHVITDNHIGDWGTQFGKVIYGWKHLLDPDALERDPIAELVRLYREINTREASEPAVAQAAREELVKLQSGDEENLAIWRKCVELSWREFEKIYKTLDVTFDEHLGESFYNDKLAPLCDRLEKLGLATHSEGALCIFFPDIPALAEKPAIIRKSDGGFLYATTDLATIEYRVERWHPGAVWYVVGAPQTLHFEQIFEASRRMGIEANLQHIPFGSILGADRKIMKTRAGDNIGLREVLDEAVTRAETVISEKNPMFDPIERSRIALIVGIGAVKYAELSQNRMSDYIFAWDKMLAFHGNTAPYLQNAYVRIQSIFRKAAESIMESSAVCIHEHIAIAASEERLLALHLARYAEMVPHVLDDFRPNLLANYLYELAELFHAFYEACPVLKAEEAIRISRLALCRWTSRVLAHGLSLMGIQCPERM